MVYTVGLEKPSATSKTDALKSVTIKPVDSFRHSSWVGSVLDAAKDANTSTGDTQGIDQPFGANASTWVLTIFAAMLTYARQENDSRAYFVRPRRILRADYVIN